VAVKKNRAMKERRLNPLNDFLFMKYMGEEGDEEQLLAFLNVVLHKTGNDGIVSVKILKIIEMDTSIGKAHEKIMSVAQDSEMLRLYQMREMAVMDYTSGINNATRKGFAMGEQSGIAIGEQRAQINYILKLSPKNKSVAEIAELTDLPVKEVNHILNNP
jgi:hypothetical protein